MQIGQPLSRHSQAFMTLLPKEECFHESVA